MYLACIPHLGMFFPLWYTGKALDLRLDDLDLSSWTNMWPWCCLTLNHSFLIKRSKDKQVKRAFVKQTKKIPLEMLAFFFFFVIFPKICHDSGCCRIKLKIPSKSLDVSFRERSVPLMCMVYSVSITLLIIPVYPMWGMGFPNPT